MRGRRRKHLYVPLLVKPAECSDQVTGKVTNKEGRRAPIELLPQARKPRQMGLIPRAKETAVVLRCLHFLLKIGEEVCQKPAIRQLLEQDRSKSDGHLG